MTIKPDRPIVPRYDSEPPKETSSDKLIEAVACTLDAEFPGDWYEVDPADVACTIIAAIEAAGYDLVLRRHRDMGPGFTHFDGNDCPCFAAAPKVTK